MLAELRGVIEISLTERRPTTALSIFHQLNFESDRFQQFYGGDTDVRLMIPGEGVVPKNDFAALGRTRAVASGRQQRAAFQVFLKPTIEALVRIMGERAFSRDAEHPLHHAAQRLEIECRVRESWHYTAEPA